ncbi:disease resistance protein RPM1-like [Alnus glutinosa]|uniref:disease resistance protein RPM1-like n=1 Tax=Alnus glutinosa TaxID=3517 RepID=UPI002D7927AF|nr:disease resistance protein RPM1-like [Alnus glutinosa]
MGGIGKTTLTKKVYENELVNGHFDCCVWITVSQPYNVSKILMSMTKQIYQAKETTLRQINMANEITLISQLRKCLQQKRYVVVFDEVWKIEFWEIMKHALPCNDRGSNIIITTRSDLIGVSCKESLFDQVHKLQPLSQDKGWELFCRKAFQIEFQRCCPRELVIMSMDIVKKCEGLPLAIVAIGGLLSTKEKVSLEWQKLHDSLKDYSISGSRLLWLCVAEGFIKGKKGKTLDDVTKEYLMELVHRNLVQVSFGEHDYEIYRMYRIHNLLHKIILSKAAELNFYQVLEAGDTTSLGKSRCLSIRDVRENVSRQFKLLKVLDFEDAPIDYLPQEVSNLFHLKHLSLKRTKVKILPKSVGRLQNLHTLNVVGTAVHELPIEIFRLYKLRLILAHSHDFEIKNTFYSMRGAKVHEGVGCLNDLQALSFIVANHSGVGLFEELGKLS